MPPNVYAQFDPQPTPATPGFVPLSGQAPGWNTKGPKAQADLDQTNLENRLKQHQLETENRAPPPSGYQYKADGTLAAIPGGPSDSTDTLDPATRTYFAQQVLAGAPMPAIGMGKQAAQARQAIMAEVARLAGASGLTGADQAAQIAHYKAGTGQITNLERMAGGIGVNEQTALANGQQFIDRSAELPGQTRFAPLNAVSDWIQRRFGGTTISAMDAAHTTFVNEYAKVVAGSPTGAGTLSDSARREAMDTIQSNASMDQKQAAFAQMKADMANRLTAIHGGINEAYRALTNRPGYEVPDTTQGLLPSQQARQNMPGLLAPGTAGAAGAAGGPPGGAPGNLGGVGGLPPGLSGGPGPSGGSPPALTLATGATKSTFDPQTSAQLERMIRAGASPDVIRAANPAFDYPGLNDQVAGVQDYINGRGRYQGQPHPAYGGFVQATKDAPTTWRNRTSASPVGTAIGAGVDGALGGTTDEIAGGVNSLLTGNPLDASIADMNAAKQGAFATNPKAAVVGDLIGSTLGYVGAGKLLGGTALAAGLGRAAPYAGAAAFGAASGAGQDNSNRLGGALVGGAGGLVGAGLGAAAAVPVGAVARTRPVQALGRMFGRGLDIAPMPTPAQSSALSAINIAGPDAVRSSLADASNLGVPMSLADTSPNLRELAGAAVRRSPTASGFAESTLLPRNRGQIDRFGAAVTRDLGPVSNIPQTSADLTAQARAAAAPLYDAAYAAPGASSVNLGDLAQRPSMQAGLGRAYSIAKEEGRDPTSLGFDLDDQGNVTIGRTPSFQTLDYVKRGLDDTLEPYRSPITGKLQLNEATNAINATKNTLLSRIDAVNPDYAAARATYAGPVQSRDALARGQDAFGLSPDELGMQVQGQSPEQLGQMQTGFRSQLMTNANGIRDAGNPFDAASTLGNPNARARLDTLYPGNPGNANLLQQRDLEGQLQQTSNAILGNSKTAQRGIADKAFDMSAIPAAAIDAATIYHGGVPLATAARYGLRTVATSAIGSAVKGQLAQGAIAKADDLAPMLLNTDPNASAATVDDLINRAAAYQSYVAASRPTVPFRMFGAGLGGGLAGQQAGAGS